MQSTDPRTLQQLAEEGNAEAQLELGKLRLSQERYEEAASWLRRAADSDNIEAQCIYGSLLAEGLGVDQDEEASAFWLKKAAERGHSGAQLLLANSFENGTGVPANRAIAAQWYMKAAEQGDNIARFRLGQLYRTGTGVPKDSAEALKWLRMAAEEGCTEAQVELIDELISGGNYQIEEIFRWAKQATKENSPRGQYYLGWAYENAPDYLANLELAVSSYRTAAENGCSEAQMHLGKLYAEGKIVARDPEEAERWLNMAIETGKTAHSKEAIDANKLGSIAAYVTINEYPPGSIIDNKYFIMSILGRGGMCMVYKAKHMLMNKMVALKMLLPELAANPSVVERFHREAQAASSLNHPNVITIYDLGRSPDGKPFMVMDYLEGQSLEQRIESHGRVTLSDALAIFMQVCSALDVAHESGIIHRDIKPSNIMIIDTKTQSNVVKVLDFGLAKLLDASENDAKLTKSGEVFGTLMYMSPEQCLGHPLDSRTDVYSVGCSLYEAITGVPVHSGNTAYELMSKHINTEPRSFKEAAPQINCPPEIESIVRKSLAKNREERHQTMMDLHRDLAELHKRFGQ